ncbi:sugar O-acetyltransferase [uncultured Oscillibacter sp.]|uniref:sugar O-acetyltransferase n=1 Tax=uncultured Oscillibacter sp. TaxID=876091 RepID=UPI002605F2EE|nr:sugar O-acetyltransferase [uncultured Oscillibacter sp.]
MTEKEKMLRGDPYDPTDKELTDLRANAHRLSQLYNAAFDTEEEKRRELLDGLMPDHGINCYLQGPIQFDYGVFTSVGDHFYANFNFTVLDTCPVVIGDHVFFGPNCTIATALHYFDPILRRTRQREDRSFYDIEFGKPVAIGSDCWFGSNVVVCGGVTIGDRCIIGAGSVVTRDIPANSLAAGNPCRVIRQLDEPQEAPAAGGAASGLGGDGLPPFGDKSD